MYKPAAQRRWGYYALPVLHGDRLVGKLDATADRKAGVLRVDAIHEDVPFDASDAGGRGGRDRGPRRLARPARAVVVTESGRWSPTTRQYRTGDREVVLDLTRDCAEFVSGRGDGLLSLFVPHATAGIAVIETGAGQRRRPARAPWATCCRPTTDGGTGTALPATAART